MALNEDRYVVEIEDQPLEPQQTGYYPSLSVGGRDRTTHVYQDSAGANRSPFITKHEIEDMVAANASSGSLPYTLSYTWAETKALIESLVDVKILAIGNIITTNDTIVFNGKSEVYGLPGLDASTGISVTNGTVDTPLLLTFDFVNSGEGAELDFFTNIIAEGADLVGNLLVTMSILKHPSEFAGPYQYLKFSGLYGFGTLLVTDSSAYSVVEYEICDSVTVAPVLDFSCKRWSGDRDVLQKTASLFILSPDVGTYSGTGLKTAIMQLLGRYGIDLYTDNEVGSYGTKNRKIMFKGYGQNVSAEISTTSPSFTSDSILTMSVNDRKRADALIDMVLVGGNGSISMCQGSGGLFPWFSVSSTRARNFSAVDVGSAMGIGDILSGIGSNEQHQFIYVNCYRSDADVSDLDGNFLYGWKAKTTGVNPMITVWRAGIKIEFAHLGSVSADDPLTFEFIKATDGSGNVSYTDFSDFFGAFTYFPTSLPASNRTVFDSRSYAKGYDVTNMYEYMRCYRDGSGDLKQLLAPTSEKEGVMMINHRQDGLEILSTPTYPSNAGNTVNPSRRYFQDLFGNIAHGNTSIPQDVHSNYHHTFYPNNAVRVVDPTGTITDTYNAYVRKDVGVARWQYIITDIATLNTQVDSLGKTSLHTAPSGSPLPSGSAIPFSQIDATDILGNNARGNCDVPADVSTLYVCTFYEGGSAQCVYKPNGHINSIVNGYPATTGLTGWRRLVDGDCYQKIQSSSTDITYTATYGLAGTDITWV